MGSPMFVTLKKMSSLMWLMFFAFTLEFVPSAEANGDFLSFPKTASRSSELCCNDDHLLTCREVEFDPEDLSNDEIQLMGINFFFDNEIVHMDLFTRIVKEMRPSLIIMKIQEIFLEASIHKMEDPIPLKNVKMFIYGRSLM